MKPLKIVFVLHSIITPESNRKAILLFQKHLSSSESYLHVGSNRQYRLHAKAVVECSTAGPVKGPKITKSKQNKDTENKDQFWLLLPSVLSL